MVRARGLVVLSTMVVAAFACGGSSTTGPAAAGCTNLTSVSSVQSSDVTLAAAVLPKLAGPPVDGRDGGREDRLHRDAGRQVPELRRRRQERRAAGDRQDQRCRRRPE